MLGEKCYTEYRQRGFCIYPSHADQCVEKILIPVLISGAETVLSGNADGEHIVVHGKEVIVVNTGRNVLLCDVRYFS